MFGVLNEKYLFSEEDAKEAPERDRTSLAEDSLAVLDDGSLKLAVIVGSNYIQLNSVESMISCYDTLDKNLISMGCLMVSHDVSCLLLFCTFLLNQG